MKSQLYRDMMGDVFGAYGRALTLMEESVTRPDFSEGLKALSQKRAPDFAPLDPALGLIDLPEPQ